MAAAPRVDTAPLATQQHLQLWPYYKSGLLHSAVAILVGVSIEFTVSRLRRATSERVRKQLVLWIFVQLSLTLLVLYVIERYISARFGKQWQSDTAGFFFVTILFVVQPTLLENLLALTRRVVPAEEPPLSSAMGL